MYAKHAGNTQFALNSKYLLPHPFATKPTFMRTAVYSVVPLLVQDRGRQMQFQIKYNPKTQSVRLEGPLLKRSIFIGRRLFNGLFQFLCNEYGCRLGRILYNNPSYNSGTATTYNNEQYHFSLQQENGIRVLMQNDADQSAAITALVEDAAVAAQEGAVVKALVPAVLAVVIYAREAATVA